MTNKPTTAELIAWVKEWHNLFQRDSGFAGYAKMADLTADRLAELEAEVKRLRTVLAKFEAELKRHEDFIDWLIADLYDGNMPDCFEFQDELVAYGFLAQVTATEENRSDWENMEDVQLGETFYQNARQLKRKALQQTTETE